ncbi:MAG: DNA-binding NarL/FixJ family response regulator [Cyclobacteriaceae bacterium]|jgi:DNA-binding NarL/FixJ family response regulator
MKEISILLVDDHKMIREGLKKYVQNEKSICVAGESSGGEQALDWMKTHHADLIVTDVSMPGMDGIEFTRRCKVKDANQKILALSMMNDISSIKKIMSVGAIGYILKTCSRSEFISYVKEAYRGKAVYSKEVTDTIMRSLRQSKLKRVRTAGKVDLSNREEEILRLICEEKTNHEMANELHISVRTIESHKRNILEKTQCKNIVGLVIYALEHDMLN